MKDSDTAEPEQQSAETAVPWKILPTKAEFSKEVEWVHQQYALIVHDTSGGKRRIFWERAKEKPPSWGAIALARFAAKNETAFNKEMLPRAMSSGAAGDEQDQVREEKHALADIERMLTEMAKEE
jgi:hypothetical protein